MINLKSSITIQPHTALNETLSKEKNTFSAIEGSAILHLEGTSHPIMGEITQTIMPNERYVLENARDEKCTLLKITKCT